MKIVQANLSALEERAFQVEALTKGDIVLPSDRLLEIVKGIEGLGFEKIEPVEFSQLVAEHFGIEATLPERQSPSL